MKKFFINIVSGIKIDMTNVEAKEINLILEYMIPEIYYLQIGENVKAVSIANRKIVVE